MAFLSPVTFVGSNMQTSSVARSQSKVPCSGDADAGKEVTGHLLSSYCMLNTVPNFTGIHSVVLGAWSLY